MGPSLLAFTDELAKLAEASSPEKPSLLRRLAPAALGVAAGLGAYRGLRKVRFSKDPALARIQRQAKGRLTHLEELDIGEKIPNPIRRAVERFTRGVDDVVHEPFETWSPRSELSASKLKKIVPRKIEGAVLPMGGRGQAEAFKGDYNINANPRLGFKLEDKLVENKMLRKTPGGAPAAERLTKHVRIPRRATVQRLDELQAQLAKKYPKGYVIKPVNDAASGGVPTHKDRWSTILKDPKSDPTHREWMREMTKHPDQYMVQEFIDIKKTRRALSEPSKSGGRSRKLMVGADVNDEFRVHTVDGKVAPGASEHRWAYGTKLTRRGRRDIAEVEKFMQDSLDKMPADARKVPMAADVVRTADGKLQIMELNAGGQSGILAPRMTSFTRKPAWNHYKAITGRHSHSDALVKGIGAAAATAGAGRVALKDRDAKK